MYKVVDESKFIKTREASYTPWKWVWVDGKFVHWKNATLHLVCPMVQYASGVFEGIRFYSRGKKVIMFGLDQHIKRLYKSAKIYRFWPIPFEPEEIIAVCRNLIKRNKFQGTYLRPGIGLGYGETGLNTMPNKVLVYVLGWDWGKYLGPEALEKGIDVCVSSWRRSAPGTLPMEAKASANYGNGQLGKVQAIIDGYAEGIFLDNFGFVSEGSAQNIFLVEDNIIYTPPRASAILNGITRNLVIDVLAREQLGLQVVEEFITRERLYTADEIFVTGAASEVTPIRSVDGLVVGEGNRGPVTTEIQKEFVDMIDSAPNEWFQVIS